MVADAVRSAPSYPSFNPATCLPTTSLDVSAKQASRSKSSYFSRVRHLSAKRVTSSLQTARDFLKHHASRFSRRSQAPTKEEKAQAHLLQRWQHEGWPVELLKTDPLSARLLQDNGIFSAIKFFGHSWKWCPEKGLLLCFDTASEQPNWIEWNSIFPRVKYVGAQGGAWLVFDGLCYGRNGLSFVHHQWDWKRLVPSYVFPENQRPGYCYLDIVVCSWEHNGMPGFGFPLSRPHGHTTVEFGDDQGNFYSVGQYPAPYNSSCSIDVYSTSRAVLFSPDPYMVSKGEKTIHRYLLGKGEEGQKAVERLKKYIEDQQASGLVHNLVEQNCTDFALRVEKFAIEQLGAGLMKVDAKEALPPTRVAKMEKPHPLLARLSQLYNCSVLFGADVLLNFFYTVPYVSKLLGRGKVNSFFEDKPSKLQEESNERRSSWFSTSYPRRLRVWQIFSKRLSDFTLTLHTY